MLRVPTGIITLLLMSPVALCARDWPTSAELDMQAAGARLSAAKSPAERVAALRELEQIANSYPEAEGAQLMARMLAEKATQEAGPAKMIAALEDLAKSGQVTDVQTYGSIVAPLMSAVAEMRDNGTLLPEAAIQLDDAVQKLDAAAAKAGLPKIGAAIDQATGDTGLASRVTDALGKIAAAAKAARAAPDLADMDQDATKKFMDNFVGMLPTGFNPAVGGPPYIAVRDTLAWDTDMWHQSTKALDLVGNAIETGHFDQGAYSKIQKRLQELSKGPWGSDTVRDFLKNLCKKIPVAGAWCDDAFNLASKLLEEVDWDSINCDCQNVSGGLMKGPLIVQCKLQEQDLISACKAQKKIVGSCGDASGPAAHPK